MKLYHSQAPPSSYMLLCMFASRLLVRLLVLPVSAYVSAGFLGDLVFRVIR